MADFSKFKIGNTSYNVKDANAARSFDQPLKGTLALKNAANQQINATLLNLDGSLADVTIDSNTLADGDVVTYDANTQEWVNKPASGGGGNAEPVIVLANATQWPVQSSNNFSQLANQRPVGTLLAIRNDYEGSIIPVSAYTIEVDYGGYTSKKSSLISLVQDEPSGTHFDLTVWLVEGLQSSQMHKITFAGIVETNNAISLLSVSNFSIASVIGA